METSSTLQNHNGTLVLLSLRRESKRSRRPVASGSVFSLPIRNYGVV